MTEVEFDFWPDLKKKPTQREQVLATLAEGDPICGTAFLQARIPRYAARVNELRRDGWRIERVPCPYNYHTHPKTVATYQLQPEALFTDNDGEVGVIWSKPEAFLAGFWWTLTVGAWILVWPLAAFG